MLWHLVRLIGYRRTKNLRAVQLLLGHTQLVDRRKLSGNQYLFPGRVADSPAPVDTSVRTHSHALGSESTVRYLGIVDPGENRLSGRL